VKLECPVVSEARSQESSIARGVVSPPSECPIEVDIDYNPTQIEQQCVYVVDLHNIALTSTARAHGIATPLLAIATGLLPRHGVCQSLRYEDARPTINTIGAAMPAKHTKQRTNL
jgi:hypothetical protein